MPFDELISFLSNLKANNNKAWFDANRETYDTLRKKWIDFAGLLIKKIGAFDKSIAVLEPKNCIFRINKDIRFSKDKSPYKTNFGINLNPGGKKNEFMGYYLHAEPDNVFFAAGSYLPSPATLAAIRQEIDYNARDFLKIINQKSFKKSFGSLEMEDTLTRPPKGYDAQNEMIEFIKLKSFVVSKPYSLAQTLAKNFIDDITNAAKTAYPLLVFLRNAVVTD